MDDLEGPYIIRRLPPAMRKKFEAAGRHEPTELTDKTELEKMKAELEALRAELEKEKAKTRQLEDLVDDLETGSRYRGGYSTNGGGYSTHGGSHGRYSGAGGVSAAEQERLMHNLDWYYKVHGPADNTA